MLSGADQSDTVQAILPNPLIVEARDSVGRPLVSVPVRFRGFGSGVGPDPDSAFDFAGGWTATTDSRGRASTFVRLGSLAGPIHVTAVTIDSFGFRLDSVSANFLVQPGRAARLVIGVRDSTAFVGDGYGLRIAVADRFSNPTTEPVTFQSLVPTVAAVDATGRVTARAIGRAAIMAEGSGFTDTAWITVPPSGLLAAIDVGDILTRVQPGLVVVRLDGSGYRHIGPLGELPEWTAAGDSILYGRDGRLHLSDTLGSFDRPLLPTGPTTSEAWGSYSSNGQWVFFNDASGFCQPLYRAPSDGSQAVWVGPGACDSMVVRPSSSPDGLRAAVWHSLYGIGILDVASGAITYLIPNCPCPYTNFPARWSPDGAMLAYLKDTVIFITTPSGATPIQLTPAIASYDRLAFKWSPDSQWLVARRRNGLDLIRVQDGLRLPLGWSQRFWDPAWRP